MRCVQHSQPKAKNIINWLHTEERMSYSQSHVQRRFPIEPLALQEGVCAQMTRVNGLGSHTGWVCNVLLQATIETGARVPL